MKVRFSVRSLLWVMAAAAVLCLIAPSIPVSPIENIAAAFLPVATAYLAFRGLIRLAS
jgi:hypothetical protein